VWGIKHIRTYLYGRKFKTVSDNKPLTLICVKEPGSRLMRWRIQLVEHDYEMYEPGGQNTNADALSGICLLAGEVDGVEEID
jgi:hypothetical protein